MHDAPHIPIRIAAQKLHPDAQLPRYAHTGPFGDLAADLHAVSAWTIQPGETVAIPTGIALGFPAGYGALVEDRSGLALRGLTTLAGVIDPGYRGEIKVVITNLAPIPHSIFPGDRIAQMRIVRRIEASFELVESLDEERDGARRGRLWFDRCVNIGALLEKIFSPPVLVSAGDASEQSASMPWAKNEKDAAERSS